MFLPVFFKTEIITCLIVGGGDVASNKVERLLEAGCKISIISPEVTRTISQLSSKEKLKWEKREYRDGDCRGFDLIIAATASRKVNKQISEEAQELHVPVNVVDDPELCTVVLSAVWRDDPLIVAVSTSGKAPFLARDIRNRLAENNQGLGQWVKTGGQFRKMLINSDNSSEANIELMKRFSKIHQDNYLSAPTEDADYQEWIEWLKKNEERGKCEG